MTDEILYNISYKYNYGFLNVVAYNSTLNIGILY